MHCASEPAASRRDVGSVAAAEHRAARRRDARRAAAPGQRCRVAGAADLTVSAAASLTNAFQEIGAAFEAAHPGTKVQFNFARLRRAAAADRQGRAGRRVRQRRPGDDGPGRAAALVRAGAAAQLRRATRSSSSCRSDATARRRPLADLDRAGRREGRDRHSGQRSGRPLHQGARSRRRSSGRRSRPKMIGAQTVRQALDYVARGEVEPASSTPPMRR